MPGSPFATPSLFELFDRLGPVASQEPRERSIGQELSPRLTTRTVVGLVVGVGDALHGLTARRAGLPVAAVNGHPFTELRARLIVWFSRRSAAANSSMSAANGSTPPRSRARTPCSPRTTWSDALFFGDASVRTSVPIAKSNAARPIFPGTSAGPGVSASSRFHGCVPNVCARDLPALRSRHDATPGGRRRAPVHEWRGRRDDGRGGAQGVVQLRRGPGALERQPGDRDRRPRGHLARARSEARQAVTLVLAVTAASRGSGPRAPLGPRRSPR